MHHLQFNRQNKFIFSNFFRVLLSTPPIYFFHPPPLTYLQVGPAWDRQFSSHKGGCNQEEGGAYRMSLFLTDAL
ncbi:hypothetical protein HanIR_Chr10g0494271 [Helianthus annuus]|nr:hypothetical protein HanIR_Chr10g0494271 [Helianthus annuus]